MTSMLGDEQRDGCCPGNAQLPVIWEEGGQEAFAVGAHDDDVVAFFTEEAEQGSGLVGANGQPVDAGVMRLQPGDDPGLVEG